MLMYMERKGVLNGERWIEHGEPEMVHMNRCRYCSYLQFIGLTPASLDHKAVNGGVQDICLSFCTQSLALRVRGTTGTIRSPEFVLAPTVLLAFSPLSNNRSSGKSQFVSCYVEYKLGKWNLFCS